jgi:DNA polymerase I-like protein with 3'-5' exonuclease and polymerase domains
MTQPDFYTGVVGTWQEFLDLCKYVASLQITYAVIDCETDSKSERTAKLHGVGFAFQHNEAFYIPIRNNKKELLWTPEQLKKIGTWIYNTSQEWGIVGHNIVYDVLVLENNFGFDLTDFIKSDTILQKHSLDEERPFGLKEVSVKYLGNWADKAQQALYESIERNGGKTTKEQMDMWCADNDILAEYCCWDVLLTRMLYEIFDPRLKEEGLWELFYEEEIMPMYREVTIDMKRRGFRVDLEHFEKLKTEIGADIDKFEDELAAELESTVSERIKYTLDKKYPVKKGGNFPKVAAEIYNIELPLNKTGKVTLASKEIDKLIKKSVHVTHDLTDEEQENALAFYNWLAADGADFPFDSVPVQKALFFRDKANQGKRYVFNINSADDLRWLFFTKLGLEPLKETESGEPSVDAETLEEMADMHPFCDKIIDYKKLNKLDGTYIQGILDREIDGVIYCSMLQFGTTSGRYSSRDPNLQNIPRIKDEDSKLSPLVLKYTNAIKAGFIAPEGYTILNADYSSLEPVCFAHMSGDEKLRDVFRKGYDLYSSVAIEVWHMHEFSADKKAANYLGKHKKELRQKAKVFCLAVVYGAEAGRISQSMGISYQEAESIIEAYLDAYPNLRRYMSDCKNNAVRQGYVRNSFGRIRHLPMAKHLWDRHGKHLLNRKWARDNDLVETRYKLKNALNNSMNFPIQSLAANIVNRAMIATRREFRRHAIDGWIAVQVHDEITCIVKKEQAELARKILKDAMEKTTVISVPLSADPLIGNSWAEAK